MTNMCCEQTSADQAFFGCRFSLFPMSDNFIELITDVISDLEQPDLRVETNDVSTYVIGVEDRVFLTLGNVLARLGDTEHHVGMQALFSKGCPDEKPISLGEAPEISETNTPPSSGENTGLGRHIACEVSMYPLNNTEYMNTIYEVIELFKDRDVYKGSSHFATMLWGSIEEIFSALQAGFAHATDKTGHTVMHVTFSCNSPSHKKSL